MEGKKFKREKHAGVPVAGEGSRRLVLLTLVIVTLKFSRPPVLAVASTGLLWCQRNRHSHIWALHLAIVQTKDHPSSHMQMNRCHKIPVTRLKSYCHLGCNRLFEIAVVTQYPVTWPLNRWQLNSLNFICPGCWLHLGRHPPCVAVLSTHLFDP